MLKLKFSHKYYGKVLAIGGIPTRPEEHTFLLNYCVVPALSHEFDRYDTTWYPKGKIYEKHAQRFNLGPGPYLILFLVTRTDGHDSRPFYWTTIRKADRLDKYRQARGKELSIICTEEESK